MNRNIEHLFTQIVMSINDIFKILQHNVKKSYLIMLKLFVEKNTLQNDVIAIQKS